jgi:putative restriction endonuclease
MVKDQSCWLHKFATLKIDRSRGDPAPHKPLLLLAILDMADRGEIIGAEIPLSPDLAFRFAVYWSVVAERRKQRPDVRLPFHHLSSAGIWQPLMADGRPSPDRKLTVRVRLDSTFLDCLLDAKFRDKAKRVLLQTPPYFRAEERIALCSMLRLRPPQTDGVREDPALYSTPIERGRDARFRIEVVLVAYRHTCALTGYRMTTLDMESIVDAAHIHEFSDSRNNDPRNGLALSKNAHWQFDRGLWSVTDDYRVVVNRERFIEEGVPGQRLADFEGHRLFLPSDPKSWPDQTCLAWHRQRHIVGDPRMDGTL